MTREFIDYVETKLVVSAILMACLCGATVYGIYQHLAAVHADTNELVASNLRGRHLVQTMAIVQDAETGQRGYLLTGRDDYLQPYLGALNDIDASLTALQVDYAQTVGAKSVAAISRQVRAKFAELNETVVLRRHQGFEAAQQIVLQDTGKHLMDAIRADVSHLLEAERAEIDVIARRQSSATMRAAYLWLWAALLVMLPVGFCLALAIRDTHRGRREGTQLAHASSHDGLTGLLNRPAFLAKLDQALLHRPQEVGLLFLDLNGFKAINDDLGHAVGDRVLIEVAGRLRKTLRPHDTLARLGGDEFVMFIEQCSDRQVLHTLVGRVEAALEAIELPDLGRHQIGGSVGTAHSAETSPLSAASLIERADAAMYERKAQFRQRRPEPPRLRAVAVR